MDDGGAPVTILFTDVEGSTDLRTRRGDAVAHAVLREHEGLVRACVAEHGGREVKALGDGFMVVFASVRRGLACAVAVQQVDGSGFVWTFLDEARDPSQIIVGAIVVTGDEVDPVLARIVSLTERPSGTKVHLQLLPGDPAEYADALARAHLLSA